MAQPEVVIEHESKETGWPDRPGIDESAERIENCGYLVIRGRSGVAKQRAQSCGTSLIPISSRARTTPGPGVAPFRSADFPAVLRRASTLRGAEWPQSTRRVGRLGGGENRGDKEWEKATCRSIDFDQP